MDDTLSGLLANIDKQLQETPRGTSGNKQSVMPSAYPVLPNPSVEWDSLSQQLVACFSLFQGSAVTNQDADLLFSKMLPLKHCVSLEDLLTNALQKYGRAFPKGKPPRSAIKITVSHPSRNATSQYQDVINVVEGDCELQECIRTLIDQYKNSHPLLDEDVVLQEFDDVAAISLVVREDYLDISRQSTFNDENRSLYKSLHHKLQERNNDPQIPAEMIEHIATSSIRHRMQSRSSGVHPVNVPDKCTSGAPEAITESDITKKELMEEIIRLQGLNASLRETFWVLSGIQPGPKQYESLEGFLRIMEQYEKDKREPEKEIENLVADKAAQKKFFEAQMINTARKEKQLILEKNIEATNRQMADRELATARKVMNGEQLTIFDSASKDKIHYGLQMQKVNLEKAKVEAELYHANTLLRRQQKTIDYWQRQFGPHLPDNCD